MFRPINTRCEVLLFSCASQLQGAGLADSSLRFESIQRFYTVASGAA